VGEQPIYALHEKPLGRPWTPRQAARICVVREARRGPEHTAYWERLRAADEEVQEATELAGDFLQMVRERGGGRLAQWLQQAEASRVPELRAFARSLRSDETAVAAGLTLEWSNGQTEAQVGRLKMLKRTMNGRASLPLLRARVLYRPPALQQLRPRQHAALAQAA
jgi:transposase